MRQLFVSTFVAIALATSLTAQEADAPPGESADIEEGMEMLSEGARRLLRGLMGEVEPRMRDLADALEAFDFNGIGVDDLGAYHPPEMLPNGDIILRRKEDRPVEDPMDDEIEI